MFNKLYNTCTYMYVNKYTHVPAYQTAQMADRRSERNTRIHTHLCLPDGTNGRSPVREKHTYTHIHPCLPDLTDSSSLYSQGEIHIHVHVPYRALGTVEVHFLYCRSSGSGRLDTTTILSTCLKQEELSLTRACSNHQNY